MKRIVLGFVLLGVGIVHSQSSLAHSGGLDTNGGHIDASITLVCVGFVIYQYIEI